MRMKLGRSCLTALCLEFSLALGVAQAQPQPQQPSQPNALQGFSQNRNQPVQINAQTLEVRDKSKVATYTGNVRLVQGDTTLRCAKLIVYYDGDQAAGNGVKTSTPGPAGSQQIRHIEAIGSVVVTQKDQTATGDKAIYDIKDDTVTLSPVPGGYVVVTQGQDVVRGRHLTVHLASGVSQFDGGDVMSVIVPKNQNQNQNPHPGAAPAHPPSHAAPKPRSTGPSDLY